jgi:FlaA1/EpsC-like NDP-sugar epimerase
MFCKTHTRKLVKIHKIKKKAQCRIHIIGMRKGEKKEKPNNSTHLG